MTMSTVYSIFYSVLIFGYWLLLISISIRVLIQRKSTSYVIAWLFIIYVLPVLGMILYFLLGENHLGSKRAERAKSIWPSVARSVYQIKHNRQIFAHKVSDVATPLFAFCEHKQRIKGIKGNRLTLIKNSHHTMDALLEDIAQAEKAIDMVFYIWYYSGKVETITHALIDAAQRGVRCRIILDSAGSRQFLKSDYPDIMREAGIEIVEALKVNIFRFLFRRMDLRQHRKMVLIDNHIAYTGSMNMVDPRFFKKEAGVGEWVDIMVRIDGPITSVMQILFTFDWEVETGQRVLPPAPVAPQLPYDEGHIAQVIASGPGFDPNLIHQSLLTAIYSARSNLIMTTPYFVPSDDLLDAICIAAQRGVDVRIIVPNKNDSMMVKWASRTFFSELLTAGVKIYEFQQGLLHTKSVLIDDQLSLIGTVNLDMRSLWLNFEITAVIDDAEFGQHLRQLQYDYIQKSKRLRPANWKKRPLWQRIVERLFYFFAPLL